MERILGYALLIARIAVIYAPIWLFSRWIGSPWGWIIGLPLGIGLLVGLAILLKFIAVGRFLTVTIGDAALKTHWPDEDHVLVPINAKTIAGFDHHWYDQMRGELQHLGFSHLVDYENTTMTRISPDARTIIRTMVNRDPTITASHFHRESKSAAPDSRLRSVKCVEFHSRFSDGTRLITMRLPDIPLPDAPPFVDRQVLPANTPLEAVLRRHRARLAQKVDAGKRALALGTVDEFFADALQSIRRYGDFHRNRTIGVKEISRLAGSVTRP